MKPLHLILPFTLAMTALGSHGEVTPASGDTIETWHTIQAPPAPSVKSVTVDAKTTAFLVLDMQSDLLQTRPRAVATIPAIANFLGKARAAGMLIAHSNTRTGTPADLARPLAPRTGEQVVRSGVDKFFRTGLEDGLNARKIKTVIVVGTAANGAVLHTATGASLRGLKVIIPVDGLSSEDLYAEQYTTWHMLNAPGTRANTTLTRLNLIDIQP